ncbi:pentapeptide repeat-containing protein [Streptomyces sp. NPDC047853]|uniref:pentapeptide repeat-containing protein n=1 Tax=Streptomyces sp. NPDC047853 TaxID=3365489 RepID=UPI0037114176
MRRSARTGDHDGRGPKSPPARSDPHGTELDGTILTEANLRGASLTGVEHLNVQRIRSAVTAGTTELPSWFYPRTDTRTASD